MKRKGYMTGFLVALAMLFMLIQVGAANANGFPGYIADKNSVVWIDPYSDAGVYDWFIDREDVMKQQWFWFRANGWNSAAGPELPVNAIEDKPTVIYDPTNPKTVEIIYTKWTGTTNPVKKWDVDIVYTLQGGLPGSGYADLSEIVTIHNYGAKGTSLTFTLFQYSDFDLSGPQMPNMDSVVIDTVGTGANMRAVLATQTSPQVAWISETTATPANKWEAGLNGSTLAKLNDGDKDDLNNVKTSGPGDATWAFQWNFSIPGGSSLGISKDKQIRIPVVPEPGTLLLLGAGLVGLAAVGMRMRKK